MKRLPGLRDLSEDHHLGLVLARTARKAAAGKGGLSVSEVWAEVAGTFKAELEPHFRIEESLLAPALARVGEPSLVQRMLEDHANLREFLVPGRDRTAADLMRFGELLDRHIRFEERELFEVAQDKLNPDEFDEIGKACDARKVGT